MNSHIDTPVFLQNVQAELNQLLEHTVLAVWCDGEAVRVFNLDKDTPNCKARIKSRTEDSLLLEIKYGAVLLELSTPIEQGTIWGRFAVEENPEIPF